MMMPFLSFTYSRSCVLFRFFFCYNNFILYRLETRIHILCVVEKDSRANFLCRCFFFCYFRIAFYTMCSRFIRNVLELGVIETQKRNKIPNKKVNEEKKGNFTSVNFDKYCVSLTFFSHFHS